MDNGLMCLSLCGHTRKPPQHKPPQRKKKMMTMFYATCVDTVHVICLSVALAT